MRAFVHSPNNEVPTPVGYTSVTSITTLDDLVAARGIAEIYFYEETASNGFGGRNCANSAYNVFANTVRRMGGDYRPPRIFVHHNHPQRDEIEKYASGIDKHLKTHRRGYNGPDDA
jgi:hypothetical protein